jgi:membrane protease YdiL (CAAX protease family)
VGIALWEEMAFRSYLIKNVAEGLNWKVVAPRWATAIAILIPSILFGWLHSTNANASAVSTVNTMLSGVYSGPRMS